MNDFYLDELKVYLDREFPEEFPLNSVYSDTEIGRAMYKSENADRRKRAAIHFRQGYCAAFRYGSTSPNSDLVVKGRHE